jgi:histone acetyltransferase (RNA polymerase elongator complex component)
MPPTVSISWSPAPRPRAAIHPVFLPGLGCPGHCLYCNQKQQTGRREHSLAKIAGQLSRELHTAEHTNSSPFELAFFGGTFTRLPVFWQNRFLEISAEYRNKGLINAVRCSTRPDSCQLPQLERLAGLGLSTVEIGAQTFSPRVLRTVRRGYEPEAIASAAANARKAGLGLGIQLLPGLPGHTCSAWLQDVRETLGLRPDFVRIYPCLVLDQTPLADMYRQGLFQPWSLQQTITALARACLRLSAAKIPIIRMGLHPEPSLMKALIAGPWHPALGSVVRSRTLLSRIKMACLQLPPGPKLMTCPRSLQGNLWGHKGIHRIPLSKVGITPDHVVYTNARRLEITSLEQG